MNDFVIYTKMLAVLAWTFNKLLNFPKKQRFVLGQQIEKSALQSLRLIIEANDERDGTQKLQKLQALNVELAVLRSLFRVAHDMNFMTLKSLVYVTGLIDEVGKMAGAWQKKVRMQNSIK